MADTVPDISSGDLSGIAGTLGLGMAKAAEKIGPEFDKAEAARTKAADSIQSRQSKMDSVIDKMTNLQPPKPPEPFDFKPFEFKGEMHDPVSAFGSTASTLAIIASAFTRAPLTSALNASAKAMNALRQNDMQTYELQFGEWKQNTDYAIKRSTLENEQYKEALDLMKTNFNEGVSLLNSYAILNGNDQLISTLRADPKAAVDLVTSYATMIPKLEEASVQLQGMELYRKAKSEAMEAKGQPLSAEEDLALRNKYMLDPKSAALLSRSAIDKDSMSAAVRTYKIVHPEDTELTGFDDWWNDRKGTLTPEQKILADKAKEEGRNKRAELTAGIKSQIATNTERHQKEMERLSANKEGDLKDSREAKQAESERYHRELARIADAKQAFKSDEKGREKEGLFEDIEEAKKLIQTTPGLVGTGIAGLSGKVERIAENFTADDYKPATRLLTLMETIAANAQKQFRGGRLSNQAKEDLENALSVLGNFTSGPKAVAALDQLETIIERHFGRPSDAGKLPEGVPAGSKQIGTSGGNPVYEDKDGKRYIVKP